MGAIVSGFTITNTGNPCGSIVVDSVTPAAMTILAGDALSVFGLPSSGSWDSLSVVIVET